jgi:FkbM family methyltransferase
MLQFRETRSEYLVRRFHDLAAKALAPSARKFLPQYPRFAVVPGDYLGVCVNGNGIYERREIEFLKSLFVKRGLGDSVMLDIGGNIGNHSIALSGSFAQVIAFEPNPAMASLLRTNLLLSNLRNVRVHEVGLGRADAELPFALEEDHNHGSGSFASGVGSMTLPVRRGDDFLARKEAELGSGEKRIGFVKCDVEGFEADVFGGLRETLNRHKPIVFFESNDREAGEAAWAELQAAGYDTLYVMQETGADGNWVGQELKRALKGYACWIERTAEVPARRRNLVASFGRLD